MIWCGMTRAGMRMGIGGQGRRDRTERMGGAWGTGGRSGGRKDNGNDRETENKDE